MSRLSRVVAGVVTGLTLVAGGAARGVEGSTPHGGMMRYPDVSQTHIVFTFAADLWIVPREGGAAMPLASPAGEERLPKFSPDGKTIAFEGFYDGNRDLYTVPVEGGVPFRVTYHPADERLCNWTPDGKSLLFSYNGQSGLKRQLQLFKVAATGGLPEKLPVPYGINADVNGEGQWLAYTPHSIDTRTWKRYRGGMQTDIWLFNLTSHESRRITDWEGTDTLPMWQGNMVYFLSDRGPEHRLNIWSFDVASGKSAQVTTSREFDAKWTSIGPGSDGKGEIVYQNGPQLMLLNLGTGQTQPVKVTIPGDRPTIRPHSVNAAKFIQGAAISPTGKRAAFEARGDLWTAPAQKGTVRNITRTSGVAERDPAWSPDGQWLAYFSDATGEYELYVTQSDGLGETRQLTRDGSAFRYSPTWSPDSRHIAFCDKGGHMFLHTLAGKVTREIDVDPWANQPRFRWSGDSDWIAYAKNLTSQANAIWLYQVSTSKLTQVTSGMFNDMWPVFDRKGDYLFYTSGREFGEPIYEDSGTTFVYGDIDRMMAVPLRKDLAAPFAPRSDEELWGDRKKKEEEKKADDKKKDDGDKEKAAASASASSAASGKSDAADTKSEPPKPVKIDLEGFEQRAVILPIKRGRFSRVEVNDEGQLLYVRNAARGIGGKAAICLFDLDDDKNEKREEKVVVAETPNFAISTDGKKLLVNKDEDFAIVDAKADQKLEKKVPLEGMNALIQPREEWAQMFMEAWRLQRDFFYDPHMHGVDWPAIRKQYEAMLADCVSREDLSYVISEMISELNVGHAYYFGGDVVIPASVSVGMLACDFELADGAFRIARICEGGPWDADARGPLSQPGVNVKAGDYLLAVNGVPPDTGKAPWASFQNMADRAVTLTISDKPRRDASARDVVVRLSANEDAPRYREWIEAKRRYVSDKSGGKVGYLYVPNTGIEGQDNLFRQFYGQIEKEALIIDERWNGGGQIPTRFIELLNRPVTNYWARRDGRDWTWPPDSHQGPKCMLINGLAGSGGDMFPWLFKHNHLGKVIGMRTWGGLVGISGNPGLIDGAEVTVPTFAFYETDGTWGVEGHGVDPDIEVVDDPGKMWDGGDPQLDAAIAHMADELRTHPYKRPSRPAYPDRRGMGIRDEDK